MAVEDIITGVGTLLGAGLFAAGLDYLGRRRAADTADRQADVAEQTAEDTAAAKLRADMIALLESRERMWTADLARLHADNEKCLQAQAKLQTKMGELEREFARCHTERQTQAAMIEQLEVELHRLRPRGP